MKAIGIIPARLESSRFENKVLADICGKPMIQHVYEAAKKSVLLDNEVYITTDHPMIASAAEDFGATFIMTSSSHKSGTSRVAQAAQMIHDSREGGWLEEDDIVINIQSDEPLLASHSINMLADVMFKRPELSMATLAFRTRKDRLDDNTVKVVMDKDNYALYFSRALIPHGALVFYRHVGIYSYRVSFLKKYVELPDSQLEKDERLEQLKILENGYRILVLDCKHATHGVDTLEDLIVVRNIMKKNQIPTPQCAHRAVHP